MTTTTEKTAQTDRYLCSGCKRTTEHAIGESPKQCPYCLGRKLSPSALVPGFRHDMHRNYDA